MRRAPSSPHHDGFDIPGVPEMAVCRKYAEALPSLPARPQQSAHSVVERPTVDLKQLSAGLRVLTALLNSSHSARSLAAASCVSADRSAEEPETSQRVSARGKPISRDRGHPLDSRALRKLACASSLHLPFGNWRGTSNGC